MKPRQPRRKSPFALLPERQHELRPVPEKREPSPLLQRLASYYESEYVLIKPLRPVEIAHVQADVARLQPTFRCTHEQAPLALTVIIGRERLYRESTNLSIYILKVRKNRQRHSRIHTSFLRFRVFVKIRVDSWMS